MKIRFILFVALILPMALFSRVITIEKNFYWNLAEEKLVEGKIEYSYLICNECVNISDKFFLPEAQQIISLNAGEIITSVRIKSISSSVMDEMSMSAEMRSLLSSSPEFEFTQGSQRGQNKGIVRYTPLILKNGRVEKIDRIEIEINTSKQSSSARRADKSASFAANSAMASGEWYKIGIDHDGIYKISYQYLKNRGIDVDNIIPQQLAVYGNGGGMLPRKNSDLRPDDVVENSIFVSGENDGSFDPGDYIAFYAEGPGEWSYFAGDQAFRHKTHQYSDTSYYFLVIKSGGSGKRLITKNISPNGPVLVNQFDDRDFHEVDRVNLIKSGALWFGEAFDIQTEYDFSFGFPNIVPNSTGKMRFYFATASPVNSSYSLNVAGSTFDLPASRAPGTYAAPYAAGDGGFMTYSPSGNTVNVNVRYNKPANYSSAKGWLDYLELNVRRRLIMTGTQMDFREIQSVGNNQAEFRLSGASAQTKIWEVTDPANPSILNSSLSGSDLTFYNDAQVLREYVAMNQYDSSFTWAGPMANQDLHGESSYNYVIVSHPRFLNSAERLASLHEENGLSVFVTTPQNIYNEFSSGAQDIVALRDFLRMLYHKGLNTNDQLRYVLLLGDGSYDNKYRIGGNTNFVASFESQNSFDPTLSYVSDDFYCLMDSNEGEWALNELMDISIGRFPVQTADQAEKVVDKIERYHRPQAMGDWRNDIVFVGDDEDGNTHMRQADTLALRVKKKEPNYNIDKIFIDAFKQYSTPGGQRYPDALESIKRSVERGSLIMNYTGHGGEVGWAHERILTMDVINNWSNKHFLPLFMTATCEFSRWDDPQRAAGGEVVFLNPEGGGIGLLTTVRLVYSGANQALAKAFYDNIFKPINGEMPRLGDVYMAVKNAVIGINSRNFTLLGDPALRLAYPYYNVVADSINGKPISQIDTVRALGKVEVKGHLEDLNGNKMTNYNGTLYPTVFDKEYEILSLNNDNVGAFRFDLQNKRLFKGKASITNGDFAFSFIVPKDIAYNYDRGRLSFYAEDQVKDASGYNTDFVVGGTDPNAADDNVGPDVQLFMNDETFVYGGITDENPILLAKIYDLHGINMAGTGIGHDITAILDGESDEPIVLNDYYSAEINSYQRGEVRYNFEELEPGPHKLTLKVWDVYNNSSEATIEFVVQEFSELKIDKVLNYPNPFTTNTSFWFEHNQPNTVLDVQIQIFTVSGKIVKTIDKVIETTGYNQNVKNPISWNARDEYGDKLARGVYIYKLKVRSRRNGTSAEKIEKLVIL